MTAPAAFRATYSDFRLIKGRKVVQLVFEVPLEESNKAYEVLGGMPNPAAEVWCAIARLNPETTKEVMHVGNSEAQTTIAPASGLDIPARARKPVAPEKRLAQRAGILCANPVFRQFLTKDLAMPSNLQVLTEFEAAQILRHTCGVTSRSEIKPGTEAGRIFNHLYSRFVTWRDTDIYLEAST